MTDTPRAAGAAAAVTDTPREIRTRCCIVGGGPAGMMLGYLLARAGVATVVLEKHADFLRDFRGDTVHPVDAAHHGRARPARRASSSARTSGSR